MTPAGDLIVARTRADEVVLLERDANGDGEPDAVRRLLTKLNHPHGLALREGWLYVGAANGIGRIRFDEQSGQVSGAFEHIVDDFTGDGLHTTKTLGGIASSMAGAAAVAALLLAGGCGVDRPSGIAEMPGNALAASDNAVTNVPKITGSVEIVWMGGRGAGAPDVENRAFAEFEAGRLEPWLAPSNFGWGGKSVGL